jgi:hypothetical protein
MEPMLAKKIDNKNINTIMKKLAYIIISVLSIIFIYTSCDNRKLLKDPTPTISAIKINSIHFSVIKKTDTIYSYSPNAFGAYTLKFICFDTSKQVITPIRLKVSIESIIGTGSHKINNTVFKNDSLLSASSDLEFSYFPSNPVTGKNTFVITVDNGLGELFRDTVSFYIKTFIDVPFTINLTNRYFPSQKSTSTFSTSLNLNSSDISHTMKYIISYKIPVPNNQISISINGSLFSNGQYIMTGYNPITVSLSEHVTGTNFKIPITVTDENGQSQYDTITYSVNSNQPPQVNTVNVSYSRNITSSYAVNTCDKTCGLAKHWYDCERYNAYNISLNVSLPSITDDGINGTGTIAITNVKVDFPDGKTSKFPQTTPVSNVNISIPDGTITYGYSGVYSCSSLTTNFNNNNINNNISYKENNTIQISVQDSEGAWSQPYVYTISNTDIATIYLFPQQQY